MDIKSLTRDATKVHACLSETTDGSLITSKECKIYIPQRFEVIGLASISVETHIAGLYAIVVEDKYYGVCSVNSMMRIQPNRTEKIKIEGVDYFEFTFAAGSTVIPNLNMVKQDILVYYLYNEIISGGKVPWYLSYEDLGSLFDTAQEYANANIGQNREITEMIVSLISRDSKDRSKFHRVNAKDPSTIFKTKPTYIPLRSVIFAATNTTSKLAGSYMQVGVVSALVTPTTKVEKIEEILRR